MKELSTHKPGTDQNDCLNFTEEEQKILIENGNNIFQNSQTGEYKNEPKMHTVHKKIPPDGGTQVNWTYL